MATKKPVVIETTLADAFANFQTGDTLDVNGGLTVNDAGGAFDTRVEGDTLPYLFFLKANSLLENVAFFAASEPNWQTMDRGFFWGDVQFVPAGNPTAGVFVYVEAGVPKIRLPTGTIIDLSTAGTISDGDKGDITVSSGGTVWTIDPDVVTYAKMQNVSATDRLLGRVSAGAGDVEEVVFTDFAQAFVATTTAALARTALGLGTISTQDSNNVTITGGSITGITDLAIADGGTGASTAAVALTNLGAQQRLIGTALKTANYTAVVGDLVRTDTSGGAFTVTMPASPALGDVVAVELITGGNLLSITRAGSQVFRGVGLLSNTTVQLQIPGSLFYFVYSATDEWTVLSDTRLIFLNFTFKTANYTAVSGDSVLADISGGSFTVTLPTGAITDSRVAVKLQTGSATNLLTITAGGGGSILDSAGSFVSSVTMKLSGEYIELQTSGSNFWQTVSEIRPPHQCELASSATTGQTLTNAVEATVDFTNVIFDNAGMGSTAGDSVTISRTGRYMVTFGFGFAGASTTSFALGKLKVGGTLVREVSEGGIALTSDRTIFRTIILALTAGDVLTVTAQQNDTGLASRTVGITEPLRSRLIVAEIR